MELTITKKFSSTAERSPRVLEVAEAFGLGLAEKEFVIYDDLKLEIRQGDVVYVTGQSGSGKSIILREIEQEMVKHGAKVANIDMVPMESRALIDQVGTDMADAIRLLSLAGLNDAYLFIRKPEELSDGQKYRFRLAKLIESGSTVWVADEFTATLDRITAAVVAFNLQKIARKVGATVIVATTHMDLRESLQPSLYIEKYYRDRLHVERPVEQK
ncbi:ATP-binding cassette domain-containing protein [Ectothiorhodospira shaposhnikovii]|uniref:ATP-binding cassette domain-containing protein n=1 Tax=Ectothiorhodospira shaposhnikovii TaxID=1054 RepID=UPI001EE85ED8|nr:ATP-binding cassette domain-containing protein [Ectothiorhodospira shaposhnikovii]MCG5512842.1 ATP-binding cassette domain-containing protein [Ectothiorhodospira shaposhnikovii]